MATTITSVWQGLPYLKAFLENALELIGSEDIQILLNLSQPSRDELELVHLFKPAFGNSLKVIVNHARVGIYSAWNQSIIESNSKYLTIWNIDDKRTKNSIKSQIEELELSGADCVIGPYRMIHEFGSTNGILIDHKVDDNIYFMSGMRMGPFFMFNREILQRTGMFDEQFSIAGDYDFCVRLSSVAKISRTESLLGYYLNSQSGVSTSKNPLQAIENNLIHLRYGNLMKLSTGTLPDVIQRFEVSKIKVNNKSIQVPLQNFAITKFSQHPITMYSEKRKIVRKVKSLARRKIYNFVRKT
jgi:GT2 family glycosyltransferase